MEFKQVKIRVKECLPGLHGERKTRELDKNPLMSLILDLDANSQTKKVPLDFYTISVY